MAEPVVGYGFREDLYDVLLTVEAEGGKKKVELAIDKMTGGGVQAKSTKYRPVNGLEDEMELGGTRTVSNSTLSMLASELTEANLGWLLEFAGRANITLTKKPLDQDGNAFGKPLVYHGKLLDVTPPPTDSKSENAAVVEFTVSLKTKIAVVNS